MTHFGLIQETNQPDGQLVAYGHLNIIGQDVGIRHISYLGGALAAVSHFKTIFVIDMEIAITQRIFHLMLIA